MNEAIFNHEPYRIKEVESNDYGFEDDGGMYHMVTVETEFVDAWGRDITLIAFPEPPLEQFRVTGLKVYDFGGNTTIWQIGPPADCPTG